MSDRRAGRWYPAAPPPLDDLVDLRQDRRARWAVLIGLVSLGIVVVTPSDETAGWFLVVAGVGVVAAVLLFAHRFDHPDDERRR